MRKRTRKMVGGTYDPRMDMPCSILQTEINHDLKSVIPATVNKMRYFNENIARKHSGRCDWNNGEHFNSSLLSERGEFKFLKDEELVGFITGSNIEGLKELDPHTVKRETANVINDGSSDINYRFRAKPFKRNLFGLFDQVPESHGFKDIFFIIDTGDNLTKALKSLNPTDPLITYRIHIMHSIYTLGDSARKSVPDSRKFNSLNPRVEIYSWLCTECFCIEPNDRYFMSSFKIDWGFAQSNWKVRQRWFIGANRVYTTDDSKKTNNNTNVRKEYTSLGNNDDRSLCTKKKLSGDHCQIWFARRFAAFIASGKCKPIISYNTSANSSISSFDELIPQGTKKEKRDIIKGRTFFLTGDWPAFSYALYVKLNAIMFATHPRETTKRGFLSACHII